MVSTESEKLRSTTRLHMKYSADPAILREADPAVMAWEAIAPLWDDLPYSNPRKLDAFMADASVGQRALISIDWCQKEIRNGGIGQLFGNSTGNLVPYAIKGFVLIGADLYAAILTKASQLLGDEYPTSAPARKKALRALSGLQKQELNALGDQFLELIFCKDHDIENYRGIYVKNNPTQFVRG